MTKSFKAPSSNPGAEFSERGFTRLVNRAEGNDGLADLRRPASEHSAAPLPETARQGFGNGAGEARSGQPADRPGSIRGGTGSDTAARARRRQPLPRRPRSLTRSSSRSTKTADWTNIRWRAFAEAGKFDEANAAIAALANVSVSIAENMMVETRAEGVMILAKISGMSWSTVKSIIRMRDELAGKEPVRSRQLQGHL